MRILKIHPLKLLFAGQSAINIYRTGSVGFCYQCNMLNLIILIYSRPYRPASTMPHHQFWDLSR